MPEPSVHPAANPGEDGMPALPRGFRVGDQGQLWQGIEDAQYILGLLHPPESEALPKEEPQ